MGLFEFRIMGIWNIKKGYFVYEFFGKLNVCVSRKGC